jgi:hypothetical protein
MHHVMAAMQAPWYGHHCSVTDVANSSVALLRVALAAVRELWHSKSSNAALGMCPACGSGGVYDTVQLMK